MTNETISAKGRPFTIEVDSSENAERLDRFLSRQGLCGTRSQIKRAIEVGRILVDGVSVKPSYIIKGKDMISVSPEEPVEPDIAPEDLPLDICYEDRHILVLNKAPGMVVHPGAGNKSCTLVNSLLFHCKDLSGIGGVRRPGIVHRLDKDTSGLMVVAKSDEAHIELSRQFKEHLVTKVYQVIVHGDPSDNEGFVDLPIGRHPVDRKKMATNSTRGKASRTRWRVERRYGLASLLEVTIETGRTHQIRVHMNAIGHPVVGDGTYGNSKKQIEMVPDNFLRAILRQMRRQALHSGSLSFNHPITDVPMIFFSPIPKDMFQICSDLEKRLGNV